MKDLAYNKRAHFDYNILDTFEAGLQLLGTEVKSIRAGHMSLRGAFVTLRDQEVFLTNATVPPWQVKNTPAEYDPTRPRKLLLKSAEIKTLLGTKKGEGLTMIPIRAYNKHGMIKLEIGLAKGKKQYSKKEVKKARDIQRDIDRMLRGKE